MRFCILLRTRVILTGILVCDAQLRSSPPYYVYVTNEASGDMSVINPLSNRVVATVPLGKRPRGIHASLDRRTIYLTLKPKGQWFKSTPATILNSLSPSS